MENKNVIEGTVVPASQMNLAGVLGIPAVRQVVLLIGVAAAVAAGFAIVLWSQSPAYTLLSGDLSTSEAAGVAEALRATDIDVRVDASTGSILVAEASLYEARMLLASQGLGPSAAAGMSMLDEQSSFGTSAFMESARYQHAREVELARTISSLGAVNKARIHLALPKQTTFIRDQESASASVLLHLFSGRTLEADQASAIVHLVASSVPNLAAKNVTLLDQHGRLLSSGSEQSVDAQANSEFKFSRRLEDTYKRRIEEMLTPLVGAGRVRAQVDADVDFTVAEETREIFDPTTVVRSEQINEDSRAANGLAAGGIPGALSNQPPEASAAAETVDAAAVAAEQTAARNTSRSSVRNYEVTRTISHTRPNSSTIRKLSVAVVIDDSPVEGEEGQSTMSDTDIERYTALVKEAVGFDEARGDTVAVVNAAFRSAAPMEEVEPPAFWEKPVLRDALKQILGAGLVLALLFGVIRPMLRGVMTQNPAVSAEYMGGGGAALAASGGVAHIAGGAAALPAPNYDEKVAAAKNITGHDPARVAQVVNQWLNADG